MEKNQTQSHKHIWPVLRELLPRGRKLRILDLGCGDGSLTDKISKLGHLLVGIDHSAAKIESARKTFTQPEFINTNIYDLPLEMLENSFDIVISVEVVEHLYHPKLLVKAAHRCLKPKGVFIITTPYHGYFKNIAIALSGKTDRHHDALSDGGHIKFFSKNDLFALLKEEGFKPLEFYGSGRFPFLWKSMVISSLKT